MDEDEFEEFELDETSLLQKWYPQRLVGVGVKNSDSVLEDSKILNYFYDLSMALIALELDKVQISFSRLVEMVRSNILRVDYVLQLLIDHPLRMGIQNVFLTGLNIKIPYVFLQASHFLYLLSYSQKPELIHKLFEFRIVLRIIEIIKDPNLLFGEYCPPVIPNLLDEDVISSLIQIQEQPSMKSNEAATIRKCLLCALYNVIPYYVSEFNQSPNPIFNLMSSIHFIVDQNSSDSLLVIALKVEEECIDYFAKCLSQEMIDDIFQHLIYKAKSDFGYSGNASLTSLIKLLDCRSDIQSKYLDSNVASIIDIRFQNLLELDESIRILQEQNPLSSHDLSINDKCNVLEMRKNDFLDKAEVLLGFFALLGKSPLENVRQIFLFVLDTFPWNIFGDDEHPFTHIVFSQRMHDILIANVDCIYEMQRKKLLYILLHIINRDLFEVKIEAAIALLHNIDSFPREIVGNLCGNGLISSIHEIIGSCPNHDSSVIIFQALTSILLTLHSIGGDLYLHNIQKLIDISNEVRDDIDEYPEDALVFIQNIEKI